jgi:hypothetical protein
MAAIDMDVERVWKEFWLPIVLDEGRVDVQKVKAELFDYHTMMGEVAEVYCEITGGRISKQLTRASAVIAVHDDLITEQIAEEVLPYRALVKAFVALYRTPPTHWTDAHSEILERLAERAECLL